MDYSNPLDAINPQSFGGTNSYTGSTDVLSSIAADAKMRAAAPFLQMMQQNQQLDLQKKQMEMNELQSPDAAALRAQQMKQKMQESQDATRYSPVKTDADVSSRQAEIAQNPYITKDRISQSEEMARKIRDSDYEDLFSTLGNANSFVKGLPAEFQDKAYQHTLNDFKMRNPDVKIPDSLDKPYDTDVSNHLDMAEHTYLESIKQRQKERDLTIEANGKIDAAQAAGRARISAAQAGGVKTSAQAIQQDRTILSNPNTDPDTREQARQRLVPNVAAEWTKQLKDDPSLQLKSTLATISKDPKEQADSQAEIDHRKFLFYNQNRLTNKAKGKDPDGKPVTGYKIGDSEFYNPSFDNGPGIKPGKIFSLYQ